MSAQRGGEVRVLGSQANNTWATEQLLEQDLDADLKQSECRTY